MLDAVSVYLTSAEQICKLFKHNSDVQVHDCTLYDFSKYFILFIEVVVTFKAFFLMMVHM